ncbi:hypothetical protein JNO13_25785 [Pseudomonas sp. 1079]|nr:hypothetical protein [Pseudomonas sp. 1079]MBN1083602.1 hypothetical protein [Pseudomonas sp. 1079]
MALYLPHHPAVLFRPLLNTVLCLGGVAAMKAHGYRRIRRQFAVAVGQHQGMTAQVRGLGITQMLKVIGNALLRQQPLHKRQVTFLVLSRQAALAVHARILQGPAPLRLNHALAIETENLLENLHHGQVMKGVAVLPVSQQAQPWLDP